MLFRKKLQQALKTICYALLFSVIVTFLLSFRGHTTRYISTQKVSVSNADWNFYETIDDRESVEEGSEKELSRACDTIHLAMVCGGYNSTRDFYVLLKSILFYRTKPIVLHLMVDDNSRRTLNELFATWQVPALDIQYYQTKYYEHLVSWIPTHHYSNQFGLLKLIFPMVVSERANFSSLAILDLDMLMLGNVDEIWQKLVQMRNGGRLIGLVENQSDWYLGGQRGYNIQERLIWPAIGRGFNTGLMLFDLTRLKDLSWDQIWRQTAEIELMTRFSTALADQDIINAVSKNHPQLFYTLPCRFNLQLNDHAILNESCASGSKQTNGDQFELIHWNSPHKLGTNNRHASDYRLWYWTFLNWDANLLVREVCGRKIEQMPFDEGESSGSEGSCNNIRPRPEDKLRTYLYFAHMDDQRDESKVDVTCVVHLSMDRLHSLDELAAHWAGPISVAIYLSEVETGLFADSLKESDNLKKRKNIGFHLVFRDHGFNYPINRLRNIALNQAATPYVFLIDADFLPARSLYEYLVHTLTTMNGKVSSSLGKQHALVVPAFENSQYKFNFPASKSELVSQLNMGTISMFRAQIWPQGHAATDYARWKVSTRPYKVDWQPDYEPFIVTRRDVIRFDERFVGFGWNKVQHIMHLAALNYEFVVLPDAFVIHQFHPASYDIMRHRESIKYRACIRQLKRDFSLELLKTYPSFVEKLKQVNVSSGFSGSSN